MCAALRGVAVSGPILTGNEVWLRGKNQGDAASLWHSLNGKDYIDTGMTFQLKFGQWKGARFGVFNFGPSGLADIDYVRYTYGK